MIGRLKLNGRVFSRSPVTPLLEVELLRAAVNGKAGLWEQMAALADDLGLDAHEFVGLAAKARDQSERLKAVHAQLQAGSFVKQD